MTKASKATKSTKRASTVKQVEHEAVAAASGAAIGTVVGTLAGPAGMVVGGVAGGVIGVIARAMAETDDGVSETVAEVAKAAQVRPKGTKPVARDINESRSFSAGSMGVEAGEEAVANAGPSRTSDE